jgi:dTDP-4-dehydrorhamnose reductase
MKHDLALRILVTGANGLLGMDCTSILSKAHFVIPLTHTELDISDDKQVKDRLTDIHPDVIVNCAAYTHVDGCESHTEEARRVNALGPKLLTRVSGGIGAYLVHLSTDYVFDGKRPNRQPYVEGDRPAPPSVYGQTKLEGEEAVREGNSQHLIVRTGWLYGVHGSSFPRSILRQALRGGALRVVDDQYGSPTWSESLAQQIKLLIERRVLGTVHATARGYCTWFGFAVALLEMMNVTTEVSPCATSEFPRPAPRPANSILENARLAGLDLDRMPHWRCGLQGFVEKHGERFRKECQEE